MAANLAGIEAVLGLEVTNQQLELRSGELHTREMPPIARRRAEPKID